MIVITYQIETMSKDMKLSKEIMKNCCIWIIAWIFHQKKSSVEDSRGESVSIKIDTEYFP